MRPKNYTKVLRPILWLVRGGTGPTGVEIAPFYISKAPVTNEQFEAFAPDHRPVPASPDPRHIAMGVSWERAQAYCDWYAELSGKPTRLPTELEWEYACRGETAGPRFWGDANAADYARFGMTEPGDDDGNPPAGDWERLKPGPAGLHAMLGSAWEWTSSDETIDGLEVLCGGCYREALEELDAAARRREPAETADPTFGFRIVRPFRR